VLKKILALFLVFTLALSSNLLIAQAAPSPTDEPGATIYKSGSPSGMALMPDGRWLIADTYNHIVWSLREGEEPELYAGRMSVLDVNSRPISGYNDADRKNAVFAEPWDIIPYPSKHGYLVSDTANNVVRYLGETGVLTAIGSISGGYEDGYGTAALLRQPTGLAIDDDGNVYIADTGNNCIRMLDVDGFVTTFAGVPHYYAPEEYDRNFNSIFAGSSRDGEAAQATFNQPTGLYWYDGALYVADSGNHKIRKIANGIVSTIAGVTFPTSNAGTLESGYSLDAAHSGGFKDGAALQAEFSNPQGVLVTATAIYVADPGNGAIRVIKNGVVTTMLASDANAGSTYPVSPRGLALKNGVLYVTDTYAGVIYIPVSGAGYTYEDVPREQWFADAVAYVSTRGIMVGTGTNNFAPAQKMDRGMTIRAISNFHVALVDMRTDIGGLITYSDTPDDAYYTGSAAWAKARGISVRDEGDMFNPAKAVSREEFVMFLYEYAKSVELDTSFSANALDAFQDKASVSADALDAVAWAVTNGIIKGTGTNLSPTSTLTRAEIAQFFTNFCKVYGY